MSKGFLYFSNSDIEGLIWSHAHGRPVDVHSSMSNGARVDVVLDPNNPWGVRVGAWPIGVSSLPVNIASAASNTALTSTLTPDAALRLYDQPVRAGWGQASGGPTSVWSGWRPQWRTGLLIFYMCVCVRACVSERTMTLHLCFHMYSMCGHMQTPARIMSVFFLLSSLYPQADILITTSLFKWKCEPRK